jgi:hypothetical protein
MELAVLTTLGRDLPYMRIAKTIWRVVIGRLYQDDRAEPEV